MKHLVDGREIRVKLIVMWMKIKHVCLVQRPKRERKRFLKIKMTIVITAIGFDKCRYKYRKRLRFYFNTMTLK